MTCSRESEAETGREPVEAAAAPAPRVADDLELVRRVLLREGPALASFAARMQCVPRFLAARNAQLGSPLRTEEIEDVAQDTVISVWRKLPEYRAEAKLETWV